MRISDETKRALVKIGAQYSSVDGKERTLEDIVKLLLEKHNRHHTGPPLKTGTRKEA
jgi:hypothetical protein